MSISVTCDDCDKQLKIDDKFAGKQIKCPKCEAVISVPAEDDRPAPRKRNDDRDEIAERPRDRSSPDRRDEDEDDRPGRRSSRDDRDDRDEKPRGPTRLAEIDDDRPARKGSKGGRDDLDEPKSKKSKPKGKKGGGLWLWLGLGGGGALLLLLGICGGVLYSLDLLPFGGGGVETKYFPDDPQMVASTRIDQIRRSNPDDLVRERGGGKKTTLHGVKEEDIDRKTTASSGMGFVTIITAKKALKADEIKSAMSSGGKGFTEEKVGGYVLYVLKAGFIESAFCIPQSRILLVGGADVLRKILKRDRKPELSADFKRAFSDADFSNSRVTVASTNKAAVGAFGGDLGTIPDAVLTQVHFSNPDTTFKITYYYKDSATAEPAYKLLDQNAHRGDAAGFGPEKGKVTNVRVSKFGSTVTVSGTIRH